GGDGVLLKEAANLDELPAASYDLVTALDVLEHVDNLDGTIDRLQRLLRPGGSILVCGPTENALYKAGRWLSGFSGDYHVRDIASIHDTFQRRVHTLPVGALLPVVSLFCFVFAQRPSLCSVKPGGAPTCNASPSSTAYAAWPAFRSCCCTTSTISSRSAMARWPACSGKRSRWAGRVWICSSCCPASCWAASCSTTAHHRIS